MARYSILILGLTLAPAALAQIGPPETSWGADRLASTLRGKDTAVAVEAAKVLGELADNAFAFDALAAAVPDRNLAAEVRHAALRALALRGDARAAAAFVAALGDEDVGAAAAEALRAFPSPELTAQLMKILGTDKKARRRADAAFALGRLHDEAAFQPILASLRDKDAAVRTRACEAAASFGNVQAVEPLIVNLGTDNDWRGRLAAAKALAPFKDGRSIKPLCQRLDDDRAEVRAAAAASLAAIGDERAMDPLRTRVKDEKDETARAAMTAALDKIKADILKDLKIR